jgi:hypothetical protein
MRLVLALVAGLAFAAGCLLLFYSTSHAQMHMARGVGLGQQTMVSHQDVTVTGNAAAVVVVPADPKRVYALCEDTGTTKDTRFGDATTSNTIGLLTNSNMPEVVLSTNDAIYAFAATSTTATCTDFDLK